MIKSVIKAHEKLHVACIDTPGAGHEEEIMLLRGLLAKMMVMVDPTLYCKFVTYDSKGLALL